MINQAPTPPYPLLDPYISRFIMGAFTMTYKNLHSIHTTQQLTEDEIAAIRQLAAVCSSFEGSPLRVFSMDDMFKQRSGQGVLDFLYYEQGVLVGYLGIDEYGTKEKEFSGMVHPEHRRKGIATCLLQAVKARREQSDIEQLILTCERGWPSGAAFANAMHLSLDFSEHKMRLESFKERPVFDERVTFRQVVQPNDLMLVASIMATDMDDDIERAREYVTKMAQKEQRFYLMTFGGTDLGCDEPVGSLRLDEREQQVGIYGFVVRPEYRGRGYGRQLLQAVIRTVKQEGTKEIVLDVDVTNGNAFGLYHSCGFEITTTFDYYKV